MKCTSSILCITLVAILAGCVARPPQSPTADTMFDTLTQERTTSFQTPPEGFMWSDLARLAIAHHTEIAALRGEAEAERLYGYTRAATRDPQLLLGHGMDYGTRDANDYTRIDGAFSAWPAPGSRERTDRFGYSHLKEHTQSDQIRLRIYMSNPFVNRQLRAEGTGRAEEILGKSAALEHDIAETVFLLCAEASRLNEEAALYGSITNLYAGLASHLTEQESASIATRYDALHIKMQALDAGIRLYENQMELAAVQRELASLTGLPYENARPAPMSFNFEQLCAALPDARTLYNDAVAANPELKIARGLIAQAHAQERAARAKRIPWFEYADASYGRSHGHGSVFSSGTDSAPSERDTSGYDERTDHGSAWDVRVAVTIPVFSWVSSERKEAELRRKAARAMERSVFEKIYAELDAIVSELKMTTEAYQTYRKQIQPILNEADTLLAENPDDVDDADRIKAALDHQSVLLRLTRLRDACNRSYGALLAALSRTSDLAH